MSPHEIMQRLDKIRKKLVFWDVLPIIIGGLGVFFFIPSKDTTILFVTFIALAIVMAIHGSTAKELRKNYRDIYKDAFAKKILNDMLDDVSYDWRDGFSEMDVMSFGLVKIGNIFSSEDLLKASYKGVNFRQADVRIYHEVQSSNDRKTVTKYFDGRMFEFEYTGKQVQNVKVFTKLYKSWLNISDSDIEMEDVMFNRTFNVYALDALTAFYLLTPPLMEKISNIARRYPDMAFRFGPGKLYVGINGFDSFDMHNPKKKLSYPEECDRMKKDVQVITDIIEIIGLMKEE